MTPTRFRPAAASAARLLLIGSAFFLSGGAALVYQVAWQRILELSSGIGIYSVAMVVAAFMAGLGIGSQLASVLSPRFSRRRALAVFAALELAVAVFGAFSCALFYDWLYVREAWLYAAPWRAGLLHFASLLVPTVLMGMSLPFLTRAMVSDVAGAARTIGLLYAVNVFGASVGALATPWLLIRFFGIRGAVLAAAAANASACAAALLAWATMATTRDSAESDRDRGTEEDARPAPFEGERPAGRSLSLWIALYGLSGFCALALEILWFRYLDVAVRSTAFTFGTLLALYLLGNTVGSVAGSLAARRIRRPLHTFLTVQSILLAISALAFVLLARLPPGTPMLSYFDEAWSQGRVVSLGRGAAALGPLLAMYLGLPALLFGLPTLLMGLCFPILQRAVQDDVLTSARKVGMLQAANIAGCIAGSLLVGLGFLGWFGTAGTLRALTAIGLLFPIVGWRWYGRRSAFPALAAALGGLVLLLPSADALWARPHGIPTGAALFGEDATGVAALTPRGPGSWTVRINGRGISIIPFGGMHTVLGATPAILHPVPRRIAIVGLGSGDTAWAAGCRGSLTQRITVFEICGPNLALLEQVRDGGQAPPSLRRFLADPRVTHSIADGRNSLENAHERYDAIEMDALFPANAYSGNLYSVEYFRLCSRRLAAGGLMCSWCPTRRARESFRAAFPHVVRLGREILVGSNQPIAITPELWSRRLNDPAVTAYLGEELRRFVEEALLSAEPFGQSLSQRGQLNHDLEPRDEFATPY